MHWSSAKTDSKIKGAAEGAEPPGLPEWVNDGSPALKTATFIAATIPEASVIAVIGRKVSMSQLAETLQRNVKTPVWDRTGLSGNYYFAFRYADSISTDSQPDAPSLAAALQESLCLRLEKRKGPVETLVIDSIEKPLEN